MPGPVRVRCPASLSNLVAVPSCFAAPTDFDAPRRSAATVLASMLLMVTLSSAPSLAANAGNSSRAVVHFDVPPRIACRDVTTEEFAEMHPHERLLEVRIEVSTLIDSGPTNDLHECVVRISNPGGRLLVADYLPKTTLESEFATNISVERKRESTRSAGLTVGGVWNHIVNISGSGDLGSKESTATRYEVTAPTEVVAASGTIGRGTGVYFKLRPSRQRSLEGARLFTLFMRAPEDWRGDYLHVHCEGHALRPGLVRTEPVPAGVRDFFVGLYLAGDLQAKQQAEEMIRAERTLRALLIRHRDQLRESDDSNFLDQLVSVWSPSPGPSPLLRQVERLLFEPAAAERVIPEGLPQPLQQALRSYLAARASLRALG